MCTCATDYVLLILQVTGCNLHGRIVGVGDTTLVVGLAEGVGGSTTTQPLPLKESVVDKGVLRPWMLTHIISTLKRKLE